MRIGINCFLLNKEMGGLRQYFFRLFKELLTNNKEYKFVFFYCNQNYEELQRIGCDSWKENAILIKNQNEIIGHLDKIELLFCPFGVLFPRPVSIPSVVTLPDVQEKYFPSFFNKKEQWLREYHFKASTKFADIIITISDFSRKSIIKYYNIANEKIHVSHLAANEQYYHPVELKNNINIANKLPERFVFYPANRWFHKNHDNLLKALGIIRDRYHIEIPCVFTGVDYENGYPLKKKIVEYDLEDQILILNYVTSNEIKYIYHKADMLCFPSFFEGFGLPLLEAMAVGCPIACSNAGSIPEVVGKAALLFDPTDAFDIAEKVHELWISSIVRKSLIDLGKDQAKKFSIKKTALSHLEAFEKAIHSYKVFYFIYNKYVFNPLHKFRFYLKRFFI
jgi:glycosyltransferase involved in cell wall biosynthesis